MQYYVNLHQAAGHYHSLNAISQGSSHWKLKGTHTEKKY